MRRQITPLVFSALIAGAQAIRQSGASTYESCRRACREANVHDDWAAPLLGFINDSPVTAEAWGKRMHEEALRDLANRLEASGVPY